MNIITIAGNIGKAPEIRQLQSGDSVLSFSVADSWQEKGERKTQWYECAIFGARAVKLQPFIRQGGKVTVCGQLRPRIYQGKDGQARVSFDVRVTDIAMQDEKQRDKAEGGKAAPADFSAEDIPF